MRKRTGIYLIWIAIASMVAGCSMTSEQKKYTAIGAGSGAVVGGAIGCGIAATQNYDYPKYYEIGCPVGVGAGAVIGGVTGYFLAPRSTPPPPPAPPPPPPPPPPLAPPPPPVKQKLVLRGVHFAFNKSNIRPADAAVLDEAVSSLKANPNTRIDVNGYTDAVGSEAYNLKLSQRRADAVAKYLEEQGIPASQLNTQGFGKTDFVASNSTDDGRAQNRRVELVPEGQ